MEQEPREKTPSPLGELCGLCEKSIFFIRVHPSVAPKTSPQPQAQLLYSLSLYPPARSGVLKPVALGKSSMA